MTKTPTLSLCMIAKNEEQWIGQAIESVKGLVHEVILVDTGSTDATVEIAKGLGAKVFFRAWDDDFSAPRNLSIQLACGDWILVLDGHAAIGLTAVSIGQAAFVAGGRTSIEVGVNGLTALVAYPAAVPIGSLLQRLGEPSTNPASQVAAAAPRLTGFAKALT